MGFFSTSSSSSSRHRSSGHRHGKSSSGQGGGAASSSSSSRGSRGSDRTGDRASDCTGDRSRRRSHHAPSASPSSAADDDGSMGGTTPATTTTEGEEEGSEEESSESEDSEEDDDDDDDDDDDTNAYDYAYADDDDAPPAAAAARDALSQQVRAHVFENGLRYHAFRAPASAARPGGGKLYALPNDEAEQNRDDMKHAATVQLMQGQLFYAPVAARLAAGGVVYDLGTGTGIWAIEVGDKYPRSVVHGVDLSPIQPNYVPRNVYFVVDDFEDDWDAPPAALDFVHMRHSLWAVDDRPALLRRIFHHLKPGGYVEFQEFVPELCLETSSSAGTSGHRSSSSSSHRSSSKHHRHQPPAPHAYRDFLQYIAMGLQQSPELAGGDLFGVPETSESNDSSSSPPDTPSARLDRALAADLAAAGFRAARSAVHKAPLGDWHKHQHHRRTGALLQRAVLDGLRGWAARPLGSAAGGLGWTPTQIEIYLVYVRKALADPAARAYLPLHVTYAQKPE